MRALAISHPTRSPHTPALPQTRGLLGLLSLEGLDASTLAHSLAAVEGQLSSTCAACPAVALEALRQMPPLCSYLERCLELTRENPGVGPAPAVLLLQVRTGVWHARGAGAAGGWCTLAGMPTVSAQHDMMHPVRILAHRIPFVSASSVHTFPPLPICTLCRL